LPQNSEPKKVARRHQLQPFLKQSDRKKRLRRRQREFRRGLAEPRGRRRLQDQDPAALCISAMNADGIDDLVDTVASRLAIDVLRMTLTFDPDDPADRERIARVYRHARVLVHESRDGRISIVADVPRRLADRVQPAGTLSQNR